MVTYVPPRKFQKLLFGSARRLKQFALTMTVQELIAESSDELGISYGVLVECLVRSGGLELADPPRIKTSQLAEHYGEPKERTSYSLTPEASKMIDAIAKKLDTSRSECLESAIRNGGLDKAKEYYLDKFG